MDDNKIAQFDMDGTLADYEGQLIKDLKNLMSPTELEQKINIDPEEEHLINRIRLIKSQKDWWLNLPKIETGFKVLSLAKKIGFKIEVLTKGPRHTAQAWSEKLLWCQKHISNDIDITITQNKGMVYGRVLVDDFPEYMEKWLKHRPRGLGLMPIRDYNKDFRHKNVVKYDETNLHIVEEQLQMAFNRQEKEDWI